MIGTITNAVAIAVGGFVGLLIKRFVKDELSEVFLKVIGICIVITGITGTSAEMLTAGPTGKIASDGSLLLVVSLVLGTAIGEALKLEGRIDSLGEKVERKLNISGFSKGFVSASILFCSGAMGIMGAIRDGFYGDHSILMIKSAMDMVIAIFCTVSLGGGVIASAIPVLLYQSVFALGATALKVIITDSIMSAISLAGYAIMICIGLGLIGIAKFKPGNMIPAIVIAGIIRALGWLESPRKMVHKTHR